MTKQAYKIEVTDTYGGEANYYWVQRHEVKAKSFQGAIRQVSRMSGLTFRKDYDTGDMVRYNARGACICAFVEAVYQ